MIRARRRAKDGQPVIVLGLSELNVQRLKAGDPIVFHGHELGLDCYVYIMYGADEAAIGRELGIQDATNVATGETQRLDPLTGKLRTDKHS